MITLNDSRKNIYSQFEEDGIVELLLNLIGTTNKICVEIGTQDGYELLYLKNTVDCITIKKLTNL